MFGETVRAARIRKTLTQARLAKLAGVSRRHLAALEKGSNVSVKILQRVASVLDLTEIPLGDVLLRAGDPERAVNMILLTDTIREALAEGERAQASLARAESLLGNASTPAIVPLRPLSVRSPADDRSGLVRDRPAENAVPVVGEIRQGQALDETRTETASLPRAFIEPGEIVLRFRGDALDDLGIADGDLLVVEPRPRGRAATGELVIAKVGSALYVGRWWQKHGRKALLTHGFAEVNVESGSRAMKVMGAVNLVVRG